LAAVGCTAAATLVFLPLRPDFAKGQWALLYLLIVVFVAGIAGTRPAILAAVLSFLTWNFFFIPPYGTFQVEDPKDWLSLLVLLAVGVAMGVQTGRMRERHARAVARERETALLNRFSSQLVTDPSVPEVARILAEEAREITGTNVVALFIPDDSGTARALFTWPKDASTLDAETLALASWVHRQSKAIGLPSPSERTEAQPRDWPVSVTHREAGAAREREDLFIPLQTPSRQSGVLYVGPVETAGGHTAHQVGLVLALANQASVFLDRKHLQAAAVQADALREADRLKSTFMSAVSHELKTPLASIIATISNLLEEDVAWDREGSRRELQAVQHDLDRLDESITELLDVSRLEAQAWQPTLDWCEVGEILSVAMSRLPPDQRDRVSHSLPPDLPAIKVDLNQWVRVLAHLLRNALTYSGAHGRVSVGAHSTPNEVDIWVEDDGPGIAPDEREQIFEKFHRGRTAAGSSGTGLGLAIAREIARVHGGRIWVEDVIPHGARFMISLPRAAASEVTRP
jgi:two-component system sensor histidine kinase KdpD